MIDPDGGYCFDTNNIIIPCPNGWEAYNGPTQDHAQVWEDGSVAHLLEEYTGSNITFPLSDTPTNTIGQAFGLYNFAANQGANMATFDARRSGGRRHAARDLYTTSNAEVLSMGSGEVLSVGSFYLGTNQITVRHDFSVNGQNVDAIVRYGELAPN